MHRRPRSLSLITPAVLGVAIGASVLLPACTGTSRPPDRDAGSAAGTDQMVLLSRPTDDDQLILVRPGVLSGPMPAGDAGFDLLESLGVRTVLSVDGAQTDIERAGARGMAYAHVPIGYDTISAEQSAEIARVFRDLPRPIYVHCHHGKHRGPAAVAVGLIASGAMSPDAGRVLLEDAGTSPSYPGLYEAVAVCVPLGDDALDAAPVAPARAEIGGFVAAMAHTDRVWDRIKLLRASGWATPATHPDLVPASEAGMLHDGLRASAETAAEWDAGAAAERAFVAEMLRSLHAAKALEDALVRSDSVRAELAFAELAASCRACHQSHRN